MCVCNAPGFPKKKHYFWKVPRLCPFVLLVKVTRRKWQWSVGSETDKLKPKYCGKNMYPCHTFHHESHAVKLYVTIHCLPCREQTLVA